MKQLISFKTLYSFIFCFYPFLNKISLILVLFWSCFVFSLKESEILKVYELLDHQNFYQIKNFKGVPNPSRKKAVFLRYAKFGKGKGKKGSIVFVNGWAENLFKYTELFYDLHLQGFSPIYTYDHRGQGFSDRLLPHSRVGYVEDYSFYRKDLKIFIEKILKDPELNKDNLFLIAHSMGGAIVLDYLQTYPAQKYFKAVVLSSPLLKIQIVHPIFDSLILNALKLICRFFCSKPVPGIRAKYAERNLMTSSLARAKFSGHIEKQFPQVILDHPSYHWTLESFSVVNRLMQEERIQKIHTPLFILQAEKEVLVSNKYQDSFCHKIPKFCYIKKLSGRHEHFLETDIIRNKAIQETIIFFSQTGESFSRD